MPDLRFGILGPLEVFRGDEPVPVPGGRRRAVLACLLVHAPRPVPADVLIEAAWGEELPADPRSALNTIISRLRAALGAEVVWLDPAGYVLDVGNGCVDAHRFEALCTRAQSGPPREAGPMLDGALALWRGSVYAEFADRDFATGEAERLERLRMDTVEARAAAAIDEGDAGSAITVLEELLADQPFREHAVELLLTALYRAGRQADALARYRAYRAMLSEELGLDPSPVLRDLESRILNHDVLPAPAESAPPAPPHWLDTSTAFVGRDTALEDLVAAVGTDRVVTVTGVGGVGKTRLVAHALPALSERLRVPITVVELAGVQPGHVGTAVAETFEIRQQTLADTDIIEYLSISHGVLVLDNCEHVLDEVVALVGAVVRRCPRIRVLATSRHRLGMPSERVLPLAPFPVPRPGTDLARLELNAAVRLFTDRVRRLRPSFGLTADTVAIVADICRRLDGLPLALELAASRAAGLGVDAVRERLDEPPTDLHDMVAWSYRLLTAEQRRLLASLSVFTGDFDVDATQGMARELGPWHADGGVAGVLAELADSSLLDCHDGRGEVRYRMLAIVRSFAAQRLVESGNADSTHLAHARWVQQVVEHSAREWVHGDSVAAFGRLNQYRPDVVSAVGWARDAQQFALAGSITGAVKLCVHWIPGFELSELIVDVARRCAETAHVRHALAVGAGAYSLAERGDPEGAKQLADRAADLAETPHEHFLAWIAIGVATIYSGAHNESATWWRQIATMPDLEPVYRAEGDISLALLSCFHDDLTAAREKASVARTATEAAGAGAAYAFARYAEGEVEVKTDPERAVATLRDAATQADRAGATHVSQVSHLALFAALARLDRQDEAVDVAVPLLQAVWRAGAWPQVWTTLRIVAELLTSRGHAQDAALLLAAAHAAPSAPPPVGDDVDRYAKLSAELRGTLGDTVVDRIGDLAASFQHAQVVDRAVTLLDDLARGRS